MLIIWTSYKRPEGVIEAERGHGSFGKLASGVDDVGGYVFRGDLRGYCHLGNDMLDLREPEEGT